MSPFASEVSADMTPELKGCQVSGSLNQPFPEVFFFWFFFAEDMTQSFSTSGQVNHVPVTMLPVYCLKKEI